MGRGTQQASRARHYIAEDDDIMLSMLEDGQASSDDIALEDIIELSDDIMVDDMQSMLDDIIELSIIELDELCARLGNAAEAKAPATRNAPAMIISFFISEPRWGGFTTIEDS